MYLPVLTILRKIRNILPALIVLGLCSIPGDAMASWEIVDSFNLAPIIPTVLETFMSIAKGGYDFFVGNGNGIIYILIWGFLAISLSLYLVKIHLPKVWVSLFGFTGGGEMASGNLTGTQIATNVLKPGLRAMVAAIFLLQVKPVYVTEWLVNPFLEFGAIYTQGIFGVTNTNTSSPKTVQCPENILQDGWLTERSCNFLVKPVDIISRANNKVIKHGLQTFMKGLRGLILLVPHGGQDFMNIITGLILVFTFVSCNLFMALLIIQAIFDFGMSLILYPFQVLMWVAKPKNPDKWFDVWPAFSGIIDALKKLVTTMIACAFILCINIAIVRSLFNWTSTVFVVAADGTSSSNIPHIANTAGFGEHSVLWLSAILTFYLMFKIFEITREKLKEYTKGVSDDLYQSVISNAKRSWEKAKNAKQYAKTAKEFGKETVNTVTSAGRATWNGMKKTGGYMKRAGSAISRWFR